MEETKLVKSDLHKTGKFFIWIGVIFILFLGVLCVYKIKKISSFVPAEAKILDIQTYNVIRNKKPNIKYVTTIEFSTRGNSSNNQENTYILEKTFHENKQGEIGDLIPILYDPENPSDININRFLYLWGYFIFFGVIGLILIITGFFIYNKEKDYNF